MKRFIQVLCGLALAAAPVAATGPVYVPLAINEVDGAYHRTTEVWVTNPDSVVQGFVMRRLATATNGTTRAAGDELGPFYLAAGQSIRFTTLVPIGFRGMLELDGATSLQFRGALTTRTLQGVKVSESEIPVMSGKELYQGNEIVMLQGLERFGATQTANLGIANFGTATATCAITLRQKDGLLIVQNVAVNLQPLSMIQFDDAFAILNLPVVPEGARAEVTCGQKFFAWYSSYNDVNGEANFVEPSSNISKSSLVEPQPGPGPDPDPDPDPDPEPGDAVVFQRDGLIVNYPSHQWGNHNYRINMPFGGSRQFKKVVVDFDFHVGQWDRNHGNGFHCIFWLNNGHAWSNMFGYVNSRGTKGTTVFQVNATGAGHQETSQNRTVSQNSDYHMHYEYNKTTREVFYKITHAGGGELVGRTYQLFGGSTFPTSSFFIEFGAQLAEGPESYTPNWRFSNFRAVFHP